MDNPKYKGKITDKERKWITNPDHFFFPLYSERQAQVVDVEDIDPLSVFR